MKLLISEAARLVGRSVDTLRRWEQDGLVTVMRTPTGVRLFDESELLRLIKPVQTGTTTSRRQVNDV